MCDRHVSKVRSSSLPSKIRHPIRSYGRSVLVNCLLDDVPIQVPVKSGPYHRVQRLVRTLSTFISSIIHRQVSLTLYGGSVLHLLATHETIGHRTWTKLNDFDLKFGRIYLGYEEIREVMTAVNVLTRFSDGGRIKVDGLFLDDVTVKFNPSGDENGFIIQGTFEDVKFDLTNPIQRDLDFDYNSLELDFKDQFGLLVISKRGVHGLMTLLKNNFHLFQQMEMWNFEHLRTPERLLRSIVRVLKAVRKGVKVYGFDRYRDGDDGCPVCGSAPDPVSTGTSAKTRVQLEMESLLVRLGCNHTLCVSCYLKMWDQYRDCRSYNKLCPMCRTEIKFNPTESHSNQEIDWTLLAKLTHWKLPTSLTSEKSHDPPGAPHQTPSLLALVTELVADFSGRSVPEIVGYGV